jgi:hypothetical protein
MQDTGRNRPVCPACRQACDRQVRTEMHDTKYILHAVNQNLAAFI